MKQPMCSTERVFREELVGLMRSNIEPIQPFCMTHSGIENDKFCQNNSIRFSFSYVMINTKVS